MYIFEEIAKKRTYNIKFNCHFVAGRRLPTITLKYQLNKF